MARNIPGSGPIKDAVNEMKNAGSNQPAVEFSGLDAAVQNLQKSLAEGNIGASRNYLKDILKELPDTASGLSRLNRAEETSLRTKIRDNQTLIRMSKEEVRTAEKKLSLLDESNAAHQDQIKLLRNTINVENSRVSSVRQNNRELRESLMINRRTNIEQQAAYHNTINQARRVSDELDKVAEARQRTFGAHLLKAGFNPIKASSNFGFQMMQDNAPEVLGGEAGAGASIGSFAAGAGMVAAAFAAAKLIEKGMELFTRDLRITGALGDVYKGSGESGGSQAFRNNIDQTLIPYGTTIEERAQLASAIRPTIGAVGNFANILGAGTAQDRAFGSELGTGATFFASMIRRSDTSSSDRDINKLSFGVAEAIGRGNLAGLQEEMLQGITELVNLTRTQGGPGGPNATMFADMIANMSEMGNKNMRGADAARVIAGFNEGLSNPRTPGGQLFAMLGLRAALTQLHQQGLIENPNNINAGDLISMQKAGLGVEVMGKNGENIKFGNLFMQKTIDEMVRAGGENAFIAQALSNNFNIPIGQATTLMKNRAFMSQGGNEASFMQAFGLRKEDIEGMKLNTGGSVFFEALAAEFRKNGPEGDRNAMIQKALDQLSEHTDKSNAGDIKKIRDTVNLTASPADQVRTIMGLASNISTGDEADMTRRAINEIDNQVNELVKGVLPAINTIAGIMIKNEKGIGTTLKVGALETLVPGAGAAYYFFHKAKEAAEREQAAKSAEKAAQTTKPSESNAPSNIDPAILALESAPHHTGDLSRDQIEKIAHAHNFELGKTTPLNAAIMKYKVKDAAKRFGVPEDLALAVASIESGGSFNMNQMSSAGAVGLMQLMYGTAKGLGVDRYDINGNIDGGVRYLKELLDKYHGDKLRAGVAYNGGVIRDDGTASNPESENYRKQLINLGVGAPPRTEAQVQQDNATRIGLQNTVNVKVTNQSDQVIGQQQTTFNHSVTGDSPAPAAPTYKTNMVLGTR